MKSQKVLSPNPKEDKGKKELINGKGSDGV